MFRLSLTNGLYGSVFFSLLITCAAIDTASAQARDGARSGALEEIVVTARKREERLQDIPLSISAFSAADIEEAGFQDLGDIALQTAGVNYDARANFGTAGRLNSNIRIRGAQVNSSLPHLQSTSLFVDGVFALGGINSMPLTDLERVEVIKGPQSAFFGRNTFAGAVNYVTRTPSLSDFETEVGVSAGSYEQFELSAVHSGPIIDGKLGYQVSARQFGRGDMYTATDGGALGEESTQSVAGTLYWEPTNQLSIKLRGMYLHDEDGPAASGFLRGQDLDTCAGRTFPGRFDDNGDPYTIDFTNGRPNTGVPVDYICGKPPGIGEQGAPPVSRETSLRPAIFSQTPGVFNTITGVISGPNPDLLIDQFVRRTFIPGVPYMDDYGIERNNRRVSVNVDYEFDSGMTLSSVAGYNTQEINFIGDFDRTDIQAWYTQDPQWMEDKSFEIRMVSSQDQRLRWVGGATWYQQEFITNGGGGLAISGCFVSCFAFSGIFGLPPTAGDEADVWGIFGALSYDITERLTLDVELRVMEDKRTVAALGSTLTEAYDSTVPRIILSYRPNEGTNIYAQYSQGALPGRVNGNITTCSPDAFTQPYEDPLNPGSFITLSECDQLARQGGVPFTDVQELDAFEIGLKKDLFDGRVNFSAAAYYWDWSAKPSSLSITWVRDADDPADRDGIPNDFPNTLGATVAGSSDMYGVDLESAFLLTDNWSANLTLSWVETEFTAFSSGSRAQITGTSNLKGNEEPFVPNFSGSLSTTYTAQLNGEWDWFGRLDVIYQGDYWADYDNLAEGPSWTLTHVRLGAERDDLRVELFVRNLFDEDTWRQVGSAVDFSPQPADFNFLANHGLSLVPQDKRTIGVRANFKF